MWCGIECWAIVVVLIVFGDVGSGTVVPLRSWKIQSSAVVSAGGAEISVLNFDDSNWYSITVPATVMAGLIESGYFKDDLFFGENLKQVDSKLFEVNWWYRSVFYLGQNLKTMRVKVLFKGINYRANIWLNGHNLASSTDTAGTFRYFEFDISQYAIFSAFNVFAVEIIPPVNSVYNDSTTDLAITFVDWSPAPPDSNMGIWREVDLIVTGDVSVSYPMVSTKLSSLNLAHLTILGELTNGGATDVTATVTATISNIGTVSTSVLLKASETKNVVFSSDNYPLLNINNPNLWWPWQMGEPYLYNLTLTVSLGTTVSDTLTVPFGIRESTDALTPLGHRLYYINKQPILVRGAGWSPDLFLRSPPDWLEVHFKYMKGMNLNTVRLEGKMEDDIFFDLADRYGILVMPGWCCCDSWQHWDYWKQEQFTISYQSQLSQAKRLRIHPSVFMFLYSSDELPPPSVESNYLNALKEAMWPNPSLASASDRTSTITGPTGVKMSGPYSWEPPNYWLLDTSLVGGAFGFLTEGGPGQNPLPVESFNITLPASDYWPINSDWNFHCGSQHGSFGNLGNFEPALNARYGPSTGYEEFLAKSNIAAYEAHRAMFEGYGRNKYTSTGVIQWMLNNPFPEMIWHLYDYYFNPTATYFASKVSCEVVHIQYSYDDQTIWVVNSLYKETGDLQALIEVYHLDGTALFQNKVKVSSVPADGAVSVFTLPDVSGLSSTYFLRLQLQSSDASQVLSNNFYWLSTTADVLDWDQSTWWVTPCKSYANFTQLSSLPPVDLKITASTVSLGNTPNDNNKETKVTLVNPSKNIAFFVHARVVSKSDGKDIWPIFWDDNYISLVGGETRTLLASFDFDGDVDVIVNFWNERK